MQHPDKIVNVVGPIVARIQLLSQSEERSGVTVEKPNVKDGFREGDVVLLKVVIETRSWRPAKEV